MIMTLNQLKELNEDELAMVMFIVNVISPRALVNIPLNPEHLVWFKHDMLVKKLLDAFQCLTPDGHPVYVSLMAKLGVKIEIKQEQTSPLGSSEIQNPSTESIENTMNMNQTGSSETTSSI